jgi:hypothetical protein
MQCGSARRKTGACRHTTATYGVRPSSGAARWLFPLVEGFASPVPPPLPFVAADEDGRTPAVLGQIGSRETVPPPRLDAPGRQRILAP